MKERPILFSAPMVRAILEGRKTQTRRVCKPQPEFNDNAGFILADRRGGKWAYGKGVDHAGTVRNFAHKCPYGKQGDLLWVRETFAKNEVMPINDRPYGDFIYRADLNERGVSKWAANWKPSIHMPRVASRITLEITGIRVEQLQDISGPDCWAEGITHDSEKHGSVTHTYQDLWVSINGQNSWASNPWVWVIKFRRIEP